VFDTLGEPRIPLTLIERAEEAGSEADQAAMEARMRAGEFGFAMSALRSPFG
jgi:hypothetical protein